MSDDTLLVSELHKAQNSNDNKKQCELLLTLAQHHYTKRDFTRTKRTIEQLLKIDESYPLANYYLALIFLEKREVTTAKKYLEKEIKNNPSNAKAISLKKKLNIYSTFPIITLSLVLLNIIMFIYTFPDLGIKELLFYGLSFHTFDFSHSITSLFVHVNWLHLLFNMVALLSFGLYLEKYIGSLKFILIYLLSGLAGNTLQVLVMPEFGFVVGASAAIFGVVGAILMREPLLSMRLLGVIKIPLILLLGFLIVASMVLASIELNLPILFGEVAHLTGLYIGIFIAVLFYKESISTFYHWIFISFGFLFIGFALKSLLESSTEYLFLFTEILVGLLLILYSYSIMKRTHEIRGDSQ